MMCDENAMSPIMDGRSSGPHQQAVSDAIAAVMEMVEFDDDLSFKSDFLSAVCSVSGATRDLTEFLSRKDREYAYEKGVEDGKEAQYAIQVTLLRDIMMGVSE